MPAAPSSWGVCGFLLPEWRSLAWRPGGLFPKLMDVPAAFPLAAKLSTCPGDTHRTLTWLVTQTVSDKVWPSTASTYGIHLKKKYRCARPLPPLWLAETEGRWCRHTHSTLQVHKRTHVCRSLMYWCGPPVRSVPLPGSCPSYLPHRSPTHD